jgi:hypothetical protein
MLHETGVRISVSVYYVRISVSVYYVYFIVFVLFAHLLTMTALTLVLPDVLNQSMHYESYRWLVDECVAAGKTTGPKQTEELIAYTKLNAQRMKRVEQTVRLAEETCAVLEAIQRPMIWLTLTEAWCGDAAQIVPVLNAMASAAPNVELRFILRDENLVVMDEFLTRGGRSIPKIIFLDRETLEVLDSWGPRPPEAHEQLDRWKQQGLSFDEYAALLHKWYAADKTLSTQRSLIAALPR